MCERYEYRTQDRGLYKIERDDGLESWSLFCDEQWLGWFYTPVHALFDLLSGHTDWPRTGDPTTAGLPRQLSDWTHHRPENIH